MSKRIRSFDKVTLSWLASSYKRKYGLRKWTWRKIIDGIVDEHMFVIGLEGSSNNLAKGHLDLLWHTFIRVAKITELDRQPELVDPESNDVKAILHLYSLESFLPYRLNESSRMMCEKVISSLGPYAVALSKVINDLQ